MRPLRFLLLLFCFVAIPVFLTCLSLFGEEDQGADALRYQQRSRLRALFSFSTPSSLFPPSAIISLTADNSTFFLARPAAFGPALPSRGLSGKLWVGKGFGDDKFLSEEELKISGFELGCSDVPGWGEDQQNTPDNPAVNEKSFKKTTDESSNNGQQDAQKKSDLGKRELSGLNREVLPNEDDGTDDHLHRPLPDSNPASQGKTGEPADAETKDKSRKPTHADIESLQESAAIAGKVVMLSRGGCGFLEKVKWAQRRGGIALIVGDNERNGQLTIMYAKGDTSNVTIPAIFTSYTSAHLLSSLVPPEKHDADSKATSSQGSPNIDVNKAGNSNDDGPVFTSIDAAKGIPTDISGAGRLNSQGKQESWMQKALQAVGFDDSTIHSEDSRRPPGSGNIQWVQVKNWDEEEPAISSTNTQAQSTPKPTVVPARARKDKSTTVSQDDDDDFVIGVQDWRDTELIAPKSTSLPANAAQKGKAENTKLSPSSTNNGQQAKETALKGGSIIPGSGEYTDPHQRDKSHSDNSNSNGKLSGHQAHDTHLSFTDRFKSFFGFGKPDIPVMRELEKEHEIKTTPNNKQQAGEKNDKESQEALWVTLTPTSVSTSPFFDTLLVLVVSPLVTLTFVYGLLLLRSRIRRRRWRAPKSVVDRLPVRTYHTMSSASSTTSSQMTSPNRSAAGSPQLRPEPVRSRQRSQTTIGVLNSGIAQPQSPPKEKPASKSKFKKYRGRQVECVVCLEEYVDGESKVMSLPCGHEFHVDCITPWLVNRRRTCPICKGDVVRSLQRTDHGESMSDEDNREPDEETSDDVQERVVMTAAEDGSAAIPIPERQDVPNLMDDDIERGSGEIAPTPTENDSQRRQPIASRWRGLLNASMSTLSGDTLWRTNSVDRNR